MHRVTLCDHITAEKCDGDGNTILISCPSSEVPQGEGNLVWRAARHFFEHFGIKEYNVRFTIEKNIPVSAGLAGGSADAAAAVVALNELYGVKASADELCSIGSALGSDIPFCIAGRTSLATGRGEVLEEVESSLNLVFVIAKGGDGVSTPAAYRAIDDMYGDTLSKDFGDLDAALTAVKNGDVTLLAASMYNTFESVVIPMHREASDAKRIMLEHGAACAMLSGSGPSVFGIFNDTATAEIVRNKLVFAGYSAHVCKSLK